MTLTWAARPVSCRSPALPRRRCTRSQAHRATPATLSPTTTSDAEPGDHHVAIVFLVPATSRRGNIHISAGIGVPAVITVPGPIIDHLQVLRLAAPGFSAGGRGTASNVSAGRRAGGRSSPRLLVIRTQRPTGRTCLMRPAVCGPHQGWRGRGSRAAYAAVVTAVAVTGAVRAAPVPVVGRACWWSWWLRCR